MTRANPVPALAILSLLALAVLSRCASTPYGCGEGASCANPHLVGQPAPVDLIPEKGETEAHGHADPLQHRYAQNASLMSFDVLRRFNWYQEVPTGAHVVGLAPERSVLAVG